MNTPWNTASLLAKFGIIAFFTAVVVTIAVVGSPKSGDETTNPAPAIATVNITVTVDNTLGGSANAGNFIVTATGAGATPSSFAGTLLKTPVTVSAGVNYAAFESAFPGYQTTKSAGCSGTLLAGEVANCNIINTFKPPANLPPTLTISASSASILAGETVTITWSSTHAVSCTGSNGLAAKLQTSGKEGVSPAVNTAYTLSCTGAGGTVSQTVNVSVVPVANETPAIPAPPSVGGVNWPNEPAGMTLLTDYSFDTLTGDGWYDRPGSTIENDPTAPLPPFVVQTMYPIGFVGGTAPGTEAHSLPSWKELYVGYWWKPSLPWQGHSSGVNKMHFLASNGSSNIVTIMRTPEHVVYVTVEAPVSNGHLANSWGDDPGSRNLMGNDSNPVVALGQWHHIETYYKTSTTSTSNDGIIRWWVDGILAGDYTTVNYDVSSPTVEFQFSPTWGGVGDAKTENDFYWYNHVHISYR